MQAQRHNSWVAVELLFEGRHRVRHAAVHLGRGVLFDDVDVAVVDLEVVGHGDQRPVRGRHPGRQVVDNPVADVIDARRFQDVRRIGGLLEPRAQPAAGSLSREARELVEHSLYQFRFGPLGLHRLLVHAVADELPTCLEHGLGTFGIGVNHTRVDGRARGHVPVGEEVEDSRHPAAHAVFGPGVVRNIRYLLGAVGCCDDLARHGVLEAPVLDIDHQMDDQWLAVGR